MTAKLAIDNSTDDLAHGQVVLVTARWILVATALFLTLWNPAPIGALRLQIAVMLLLAFGNFYLNLEVLRRRRTLRWIIFGASAADLAVITLFVLSGGGFESNAFVFYFPALLALSVAFPTVLTILYSLGMLSFYALVCLVTIFASPGSETWEAQALIARLLMLTAVAVCGSLYRRIETDRRAAADQAHEELETSVRKHRAQPA